MGPVNYKGQVPAVAPKITIYLFNPLRRGRDGQNDRSEGGDLQAGKRRAQQVCLASRTTVKDKRKQSVDCILELNATVS